MDPNIPVQPTPPIMSATQTPVMQPVPSAPSNSSNKTKYILLGILILLIIAAVGGGTYYLGVVKHQFTVQKNNNLTTVTPSPTSTPNPTENWKTYTNDKYKFSLKYSSDLSVNEAYDDPTGALIYFYNPKIGTPSGIIINASIINDTLNSIFPGWIKFANFYASPSGSIVEWYNGGYSQGMAHEQIIKGVNKSLDGYRAFDYIRHSLPTNPKNPETGVGTYIELPQGYVLLIESNEDNQSILSQMLTTFKQQK